MISQKKMNRLTCDVGDEEGDNDGDDSPHSGVPQIGEGIEAPQSSPRI